MAIFVGTIALQTHELIPLLTGVLFGHQTVDVFQVDPVAGGADQRRSGREALACRAAPDVGAARHFVFNVHRDDVGHAISDQSTNGTAPIWPQGAHRALRLWSEPDKNLNRIILKEEAAVWAEWMRGEIEPALECF